MRTDPALSSHTSDRFEDHRPIVETAMRQAVKSTKDAPSPMVANFTKRNFVIAIVAKI